MSADRLALIKKQRLWEHRAPIANLVQEDHEWLIAEVERLALALNTAQHQRRRIVDALGVHPEAYAGFWELDQIARLQKALAEIDSPYSYFGGPLQATTADNKRMRGIARHALNPKPEETKP